MTFDATFWVAVSFVIFFGALVYLKVPQNVNNLLSKMITEIKNEIDESEKLRAESKKLLDELMADGLLVSKGEGYEISQSGNQFLRNVCTLFDPHYHSTTKKERVFSQSV